MVDQMVLQAQRWVNKTYGSVPGYNPCDETGSTGWDTMFSLTRALQHELGITTLSDSFGPTTFARLSSYGPVGISSSNTRMRVIAEAALYCKGYSGGALDGSFDVDTQTGLTAIVRDMGLPITTIVSDVTPKVFKALLNMDAYVLTGEDGSDAVQTCQRWLNASYIGRGEFFVGPCDGHFSRNVQTALVYALQYQLGMTDSQVTGAIGPGTRAGLQAQAGVRNGSQDNGPTGWVRLFQCALAFNNYGNRWGDGGGTFSAEVERIVKVFQRFCMLAETGAGDYQTWMSLLVSTGDPERFGNAIDCMMPLNGARLKTVKDRGHTIVGRYLTGGTNKVLTHSEIALITEGGLSFFPIYQEFGDGVEHFTYSQGRSAGAAACAAARGFGIPYGTVIYFSVDFDAQDGEISSSVIPHFQGVRDAVAADGDHYSVGVYGCRNVCIRLQAAGLASRSFVSGMSTGFSGNLGFPLPQNWAFDQIKNLLLAAGTPGELEIDNDISSGRDLGVNSVTRPRDPNDGFYTMLIWLEARAGQWREQHSERSAPELVAQWLRMRSNTFGFTGSDTVFGELDSGFIDFVRGYAGRPDDRPLRDPRHLWDSDLDHFGASFGSVLNHDIAGDRSQVNLADFGTWGGDALSVLGQWFQSGLPASQAYAFAADRLATRADNSYLSLSDYIADVDAWVLGQQSRADPNVPLSTLFKQAYASPATASSRYASFFARRFNSDADLAKAAANSMFYEPGDSSTVWIRDLFWLKQFGDLLNPTPVYLPAEAREGVARAFADLVVRYARA
ncbi:glycoside hydrolase domain-containing protein [Actinoplanes sp. CA-051413]|uniref:glycoside hydrolase domain-containing protein n=1 Tax=Actinoplanes sp. CA-051413 TaxID=3239899 RepID=UPI003D957894